MIFDRETCKRFFQGYDIIDCTLGFEEGRLGFLLAEINEGKAHDNPYQVRLLAVKLTNPVETRLFSLSANALSLWADLSSAWARRVARNLSGRQRMRRLPLQAQGPQGPRIIHSLSRRRDRLRAALRQRRASRHGRVFRGLAVSGVRAAGPRPVARAHRHSTARSDEGGSFANNPSMTAIVEAIYQGYASATSDIVMLSLGTGANPVGVPTSAVPNPLDWGVTHWLWPFSNGVVPATALLNLTMDATAELAATQAGQLLGGNYMRANLPLAQPFGLDDYKHVGELVNSTQDYIENSLEWAAVRSWVGTNWN